VGSRGVFVVAPNRLLREALVRLLSGKGDFQVRGADEFSPSTAARIASLKTDVVVLCPAWSDVDFRSVRVIHEAAPNARIMMIAMEDDEAVFVKAVQAGATAYVLKDADGREVVEAARRLAQNQVVCPPHLERALFKLIAGSTAFRPSRGEIRPPLTAREQKLVSLVSQGLTNKEIGTRLNLSEYTVKNHVHRILQKTGAGNRNALAHLAATSRIAGLHAPEGTPS
jgi:two-component system, NarL family, response regulator DevR